MTMHANEGEINSALVQALVESQFPELRGLHIERVESAGTDHAMFRLGSDLAVRLPLFPTAESQVHKEQNWLPFLAPQLTLPIPAPVARGVPGDGFTMEWSIYRWLDGTNAFDTPISDLHHAAVTLGHFGAALRRVDASTGPPGFRAEPLSAQEADVLAAINDLGDAGVINKATALDAWQRIIRLPQWNEAPVWAHGDLLPGNLLVRDGRLSAVIDFGCVGVGDPACDMMVAWNTLSSSERDVFRECSEVDDATWDRGRGWALGFGLMAYHYHQAKNPMLAAVGLRSISEALPEFAS